MSVSECDALTDGGRSSRHRRLLHRWSRLTQQWRPWQASLNRCTRQTENSLIFINAFIYHVSSSSSFYCCLLLSPCPTYVRVDWLIEHGFTSAPTQYRLYGRRVFTGLMTQPTVSKHWRRVVSHPDRAQSNHAHLTVLQYYSMHGDIIQEYNLTHKVT